jgi:hypothetical protein
MYTEPHPALFGDGPENTFWQKAHGAGGGVEAIAQWVFFDSIVACCASFDPSRPPGLVAET